MSPARCIYREEHDDTHLEIWDEGDLRSLWFDDVILQSQIHRHDPAILPNPVNRAMLAHLMFGPSLNRVMLAGCGGGAIARWLHARAPDVSGDAVELSRTVARLAREYFDFPPPDDSNWRLLINDVREHLLNHDAHYDLILVDLEENQGTPSWLTSSAFLDSCRNRLSPGGTLTLNLIVSGQAQASEALLMVRRVFEGGILLVTDPNHDNLLVMAFADGLPQPPDNQRLTELGRLWGIDFRTLAAQARRLEATP